MIGADKFINDAKPDIQARHATQRYLNGVSDVDMWNLDCLIADVIVAGCNWYLENGQTAPWHLPKDEWDEILVTIRDGFAVRNECGAPEPPEPAWECLKHNFRFFWD